MSGLLTVTNTSGHVRNSSHNRVLALNSVVGDEIWSGSVLENSNEITIASMIESNAGRFGDHLAFQRIENDTLVGLSWNQLRADVSQIQGSLRALGFQAGDRLGIVSRNRQEMLELELAVMAMGGVSVPVFAGYPAARVKELLRFSEVRGAVVSGQSQLDKLEGENFAFVISFDPVVSTSSNLYMFEDLLSGPRNELLGRERDPTEPCLMMFTSGTTGFPKCVELSAQNILSQQAALRSVWTINEKDRFLSYLPWHHSFGGIFEKFGAIVNGATLTLEPTFGKDIDALLEHWAMVRPTTFFSVPRIYQELITRSLQQPEVDKVLFHDELRFIFTAAAPLPTSCAEVFEKKGIKMFEGWGLTETAPCCTVTDPALPRQTGVVGKPLPGIELKLGEEGEILVRGPNVMRGYFNNPEANERAFTGRWFHTGDLGEFTPDGLRLLCRKDRVLKLSNGEKVVPTEVEEKMTRCGLVSHAYVTGSGRDYLVGLFFPNQNLLGTGMAKDHVPSGCVNPGSVEDLQSCISSHLQQVNLSMVPFQRVKKAMLVMENLTVEGGELTPSMKLAAPVVERRFGPIIESLYNDEPVSDSSSTLPLQLDDTHLTLQCALHSD